MKQKRFFFISFGITLLVCIGALAGVLAVHNAASENARRAAGSQVSQQESSSDAPVSSSQPSSSASSVSSPSASSTASSSSSAPQSSSSAPADTSSAAPVTYIKGRVAYLTFDDGPSYNTPVLLNILRQYDAPATFFTVAQGKNTPQLRNWLRMEYSYGNSVELHSFTHNYNYIYATPSNYIADFNAMESIIVEATGHKPTFCRFPGGTDNTVSIRVHHGVPIMPQLVGYVESRGYTPVDWNAGGFDAVYPVPGKEYIANTIVNQCQYLKRAVILMHDSAPHASSVEAVPEIITRLRAMGYTFEKLTPGTSVITREPATHR